MIHTQYKFKHLRNLDELKVINPGQIIGVGQLVSDTIPAKCISNDGEKIELLGNMDDKYIVRYNLNINDIEKFYPDGSIMFMRGNDNRKFIKPKSREFKESKKELIKSNLWGLLK